ncbi:hypothetical protein [Nonlabens xiamenensis]|uniref:hypothetical protein n=1 Tax=Nonlabens xiamenensis TaxID=2341043 RepID=UPI000F60BCFB|nr:hypothetical protein [Nonlabens xiamenensis]
MKLRYLFYTILLVLTACSPTQNTVVNPTPFQGIKSIKTTVYKASGTENRFVKEEPTDEYEYAENEIREFDLSGHLLKHRSNRPDGSLLSEKGYRYNENTGKKELIYTMSSPLDSLTYTYTYRLDGQPKARQERKRGEIMVSTDFQYDDEARLIEEKSFDLVTTDYHTIAYAYPNDTKTVETHFDDNNRLQKTTIKVISDNGKTEEITEYNAENNPVKTWTYYRNALAQLVRKTTYNHATDDFTDTSFTYNDNGFEAERVVFKSAEEGFHTYTYGYQNSSRGDWIQKTVALDGEPAYLIQRSIEFYPNLQ